MSESVPEARTVQAAVAGLAAVIERAFGDLALAEEPPRFVALLEAEPDHESRLPSPSGSHCAPP